MYTKPIPLYQPPIVPEVLNSFSRTFQSGWWGSGPECKKLQANFTDAFGGWAIATNSCTSALYLAARLLKSGPEDEILIPAITWISSATSFVEAGWKVKIADVNEQNFQIDEESILNNISKHTKAILVVHLYGQKLLLQKIAKICREKNLFLIEDCAHRIDLDDPEKSPADIKCYSFNVMKEVPAGEGGLIWGKDLSLYEKAFALSNSGIKNSTYQRSRKPFYQNLHIHQDSGLKLQMHDLTASVANHMLSIKHEIKAKREEIFRQYKSLLAPVHYKLSLPEYKEEDSYLMLIGKVESPQKRNELREFLAKKGISTNIHYPALSLFPLFSDSKAPRAENISKRIITLPFFPNMNLDQINYVVASIEQYYEHA